MLGRRVYLVQPGEWLIPQKLWYTLSAAIDGILWTAFAYSEFATLSPLARVVVCSIFILPYAHLTAVTMQGGRDVTDAAIFQLRRKLHGFAEAEDTRDFFDDLSQRPSPVSENNGKPL